MTRTRKRSVIRRAFLGPVPRRPARRVRGQQARPARELRAIDRHGRSTVTADSLYAIRQFSSTAGKSLSHWEQIFLSRRRTGNTRFPAPRKRVKSEPLAPRRTAEVPGRRKRKPRALV